MVDVLVDAAPAHLGALSYRLPGGVSVMAGQAVTVPFGKRSSHGMVIGPGDPQKASRQVTEVWGTRLHPVDLDVLEALAPRYLTTAQVLARRSAPKEGKGEQPLDAGAVSLCVPEVAVASVADRYLLRSPLTSPAHLAATAAARLAADKPSGQVLVVCPTRVLATAVTAAFSSGAAMLDTPGAWSGFVAGSVPIGVGTRTAALWSPANLVGFVIVEEDHPGHKEAREPRTNARDLVVARARARGVPVCLTGSTPTSSGLGAGVKVVRGGPASDMPAVTLRAASGRVLPSAALVAVKRAVAQGKNVAVVAPSLRVRHRCGNCRNQLEAPTANGPTARCVRCGSDDVVTAGWDAARLASLINDDRVEVVAPGRRPRKAPDLVVVPSADVRLSSFSPEGDVLRRVVAPLEWLRPGGSAVVIANDIDYPVLQALAAGDQRAAARQVWNRARKDSLPPFGRLVEVNVARKTAPATASLPGQVFGPRKESDGEWVVLVRCADGDLPAVAAWLTRLRKSSRVRVSVQ